MTWEPDYLTTKSTESTKGSCRLSVGNFSFPFQWFTFKFLPVHSTPQAGSRSTPVSGEAEVDAFIKKWSDKDGGEVEI